MKKTYYLSPECEVIDVRIETSVLSGGELGDPGLAGSELDVLTDPIIF